MNNTNARPEICDADCSQTEWAWFLRGPLHQRSAYLLMQTCDDGYDYTIYDGEYKEIDGGALADPYLSPTEAKEEILKMFCLERMEANPVKYENVFKKLQEYNENL